MADSIEAFGFVQPIVVDKNNEIIIGHCRYEASKLRKIKTVPTLLVDNLTDEQVKALRIADNKLNESGWDMELIREELKMLDENLVILTGFELSDMTDDLYTSKVQTPIYEPAEELPSIKDLVNTGKTDELSEEIKKAKLPKDIEKFLLLSAQRHNVFNYSLIADFYSKQDDKVKDLFEKLALVIIDYDKAIENGFVEFVKKTQELQKKEYE